MEDTALEEITLAELLQLTLDARQTDLNVAMPAKVEAYDSSAQTVDVVPALNRSVPDGQGNFISQPLPKLSAVPVAFPRSNGFSVTFPISVGDTVLLVFCQRNIGIWRSNGNQGDPGDVGMHTLDGAVAIPGFFQDSQPSKVADGTNMVIGSESAKESRIEIKPSGGINLGAGASKGVSRNGDHSDVGTLTLTVTGTSVLSGTYTDPDGTPTVIANGVPIPLKAKLNEGSANINAVD